MYRTLTVSRGSVMIFLLYADDQDC